MNENKFTPRAEEALRLSQEAAGDLGHGYVGTEHLLAGILREGNNMAVRILRTAGVDTFKQRLPLVRGKITVLTAYNVHAPLGTQFGFRLRQNFRLATNQEDRRSFLPGSRHKRFPKISPCHA